MTTGTVMYLAGISYVFTSTFRVVALICLCGCSFVAVSSLPTDSSPRPRVTALRLWLLWFLVVVGIASATVSSLYPDRTTWLAMYGIQEIKPGTIDAKGEVRP